MAQNVKRWKVTYYCKEKPKPDFIIVEAKTENNARKIASTKIKSSGHTNVYLDDPEEVEE